MWQYTRKLSLSRRNMTLRFSNHSVVLDPDGVVISEVSDELERQLKANPAFRKLPEPPQPEVKAEPAPAAVEATEVAPECDTMDKPKSSRKRASSRSRRKSSSDKQD